MGVPYLFRHFARRCPRAVTTYASSSSDLDVAELHVDFNSVINTCARAVLGAPSGAPEGAPSGRDLEGDIIRACIAHLGHLEATLRPTSLVHVAVDGVPPRAKMHQ